MQSEAFFDEGTLTLSCQQTTLLSENPQFNSSLEAVPRAPIPNTSVSKGWEGQALPPSAAGTDHLSTSRFEFLSESPAQVLKSCFWRSRRTSRDIAEQQALMLQQEGSTLEEHEAGTPVYNGRGPGGTISAQAPWLRTEQALKASGKAWCRKQGLFRQQLTLGLLSENTNSASL